MVDWFKVHGSRFRVQGSGFMVQGSRIRGYMADGHCLPYRSRFRISEITHWLKGFYKNCDDGTPLIRAVIGFFNPER
jgi:hypothetical protein